MRERQVLGELLFRFGEDGFSTPDHSLETLRKQCEAWKTNLQTGRGNPGPRDPIGVESEASIDLSAAGADPELEPVLEYFARRRRSEAEYAGVAVPGLVAAFWDLVSFTRDGLWEDERDDHEIQKSLAQLAQALGDGNATQIRVRAEQAVRVAARKSDHRRRRSQERLRTMGAKLEELRGIAVHPDTASTRDPATGLPGRRALDAELEQERTIAILTGKPCSVVKMRLQMQGRVATRAMHDRFLRHVSDRLRSEVNVLPLHFGRYAGEDLVAICPGEDESAVAELASQWIKHANALAPEVDGRQFNVPVFAGVACMEGQERRDEWVGRGEEALRGAIAQGLRRALRYSEL